MISHECEIITWMTVTKKIWSTALKMNVDYSFVRWNLSDDYNFEMNDNDIADQLRLVYRIMRFQHNVKWWWALFLWGYEVSLVNSYIMYRRYCELKGVTSTWTHHNWHEAIGYAHVDPDEYWPRRKSPIRTNTKSNAEKRSQRIDTQALSPTRGRLRSRLANTGHMPVAAKGIHVCQLHRWAYKEFNPDEPDNAKPKGSRASVMKCRECDVHLCIPCFEIFHTSERLRPMIPRILRLPD
jgi:hypothetical protein